MWADSPTLRLIIFSSLIGFAVFCASYSVLVWRRRNRSAGNTGSGLLRLAQSWAVTAAMIGLLLMAIGYAVRDAVTSEGLVSTEGLYAVKAHDDLTPVNAAKVGAVQQGDLLVRYQSPKMGGEIQEAELKLKRMQSEAAALAHQPLPYDSELVRRHQNADARRRSLESSLDNVVNSLETAARENKQQLFSKQETVTKIDGDLTVVAGEIKQAEARRDIALRQLARELDLNRRGTATGSEVDERRKEVAGFEAEVAKLQARETNLKEQRLQALDILAKVAALGEAQAKSFGEERTRIKSEWTRANEEVAELTARLQTDEIRARKLRDGEKEQKDYQVKELATILAAKKQTVEVRAPFTGKVFYAHPSGTVAPNGSPVIVMGPADGFRLKVRVPAAQVDALRTAEEVSLDVGDSLLARRFPATFRTFHELPAEPETVIAELDTNPPPETVRAVAMAGDDGRTRVKLTWRFPLWTFLPFKIGVFLFALGVLGWMFAQFGGAAVSESAAVPAPSPVPTPALKIPVKKAAPQPEKTAPPVEVEIPLAPAFEEPRTAVPNEPAIPVVAPVVVTPMESTPATAHVFEATPVAVTPLPDDTALVADVREMLRNDPASMPVSESSALLELVAGRLRESIHREFLEADIVESAEWAIAKHGPRAMRVFRQVFREDRRYVPHLESLLSRVETPAESDPTPAVERQRDLARRTASILDTIGARFLAPHAVA